jgi:beta-glucanase (GH16 family)
MKTLHKQLILGMVALTMPLSFNACSGGSGFVATSTTNLASSTDDGGGSSGGGGSTASGGCATSAGVDGTTDVSHPSGEAPPTCSPPGYTMLINKDFNSASESSGMNMYTGAAVQYNDNVNTYKGGGHTTIHDGILDMEAVRPVGAAYATVGWAQLNSAMSNQVYGKYLIRFRLDAVSKLAIAPLLWPVDNQWPAHGEIDFAEDDIGNRQIYANTHYAGPNNANYWLMNKAPTAANAADWHTWGVEWTPTSLTFTVDGAAWGTVTNIDAVPQTKMYLGFVMNCFNGACPEGMDAHWEIDWMTIYSYTPGTAEVNP